MNVSEILNKAYRLTNTNATTFLDGNSANVLKDLNTEYGNRTLQVLKVRQDLNHLITEAYTDLKSMDGLSEGDNGYNGQYTFATTLLRPVRVEVSYDGKTWRPCEIYDLNDNSYSEHDEDDINSTFTTDNPFVRFEDNSYFIRPLKTTSGDISKGIHIWYEERQTDLTTGSPELEDNLHNILAYDMAYLEILMHPDRYSFGWKRDFKEKRAEINELFNDFYKNRFKRKMRLRSKKENYN